MKISKEIKVALLVLSGILLFVFGFNYLKGQNLLNSSRTFYAVYDNVEGLTASTPVTINGLPVGKVVDLGFKGDGSGKLLVKLLVDSEFKFSKNSKAELYEIGLIGGKAIAIVPAFDGAENAPDEIILEGTVKEGLSELVNRRLTPLQEKIEVMMVSSDKFLNNLNGVFDEKTKKSLQNAIAGLGKTLSSFEETSSSLNGVIKNNGKNIDSVITNTKEFTNQLKDAQLGKTINELESTLKNLDSILSGINSGKGTLGKLTKDEALYNNLKGASKEMEELLRDIKLHPKRYFRILSKKEIPYSKPEPN